MQIGSLELQVMVSDRPVREYGHHGRTYIEARKGSKFTLKLRNNTAQRVLAIPSVDGLSTVDGQPATGASKGYVIPAYSSVEIKGWKCNLRETADFIFQEKAANATYAGQTHGDQNCGVIAVKMIAEKFVPPPMPQRIVEEHHHHHYPYWRPWPSIMWCSTGNNPCGEGDMLRSAGPRYTCNLSEKGSLMSSVSATESDVSGQLNAFLSSMNAKAETPDFNMGTGFGQVREDVVSEVSFERGLELATFEIFYSDEASLTAAGIPLTKAAQISKPVPQGFGGFCRPPAVTA